MKKLAAGFYTKPSIQLLSNDKEIVLELAPLKCPRIVGWCDQSEGMVFLGAIRKLIIFNSITRIPW
jgi:hypothetical protein